MVTTSIFTSLPSVDVVWDTNKGYAVSQFNPARNSLSIHISPEVLIWRPSFRVDQKKREEALAQERKDKVLCAKISGTGAFLSGYSNVPGFPAPTIGALLLNSIQKLEAATHPMKADIRNPNVFSLTDDAPIAPIAAIYLQTTMSNGVRKPQVSAVLNEKDIPADLLELMHTTFKTRNR